MAATLLTQMASGAFPSTWLETHVLLVALVIGMAGEAADMAAVKLGIARFGAAALREQDAEVTAVCHLLCVVGMPLTEQIQCGAQKTCILHISQNLSPEFRFCPKLGEVANAVETVAGS